MGSIAFLEQMVLRFSSEGAAQASSGREFTTYVPTSIKDNMVVTVAEEVTLTFDDPVLINTDGLWTITEKGKAAGYTMDPATGGPLRSSPASVTVVARTCAEADAWATALMVLGPKAGGDLAAGLGLDALFLMREAEGIRPYAAGALFCGSMAAD